MYPTQYLLRRVAQQVPPYDAAQMGQGLAEALARFLFPLLVQLDRLLDKRFSVTFCTKLYYREALMLLALLSEPIPSRAVY